MKAGISVNPYFQFKAVVPESGNSNSHGMMMMDLYMKKQKITVS